MKSKDMTIGTLAVLPVVLPFVLLITMPLGALRAFVVERLWQWHAVRYFNVTAVPAVGFFGLLILLSLLTYRHRRSRPGGWVEAIVLSVSALGAGWIVHVVFG